MSDIAIVKRCLICDSVFIARDDRYRCCSHSCGTTLQWREGKIRSQDLTGNSIPCEICHELFYVPRYKTGKARFCSRKCAIAAVKSHKFGFQKSNKPPVKYEFIVTPDGRRTRVHRYLMEIHLGRKLLTTEHVHHIDGNGLNNSIDNLVVLTDSEHHRLHSKASQVARR